MAPWYLAGAAVIAAAAYVGEGGGRPEAPAAAIRTASIDRKPVTRPEARPVEARPEETRRTENRPAETARVSVLPKPRPMQAVEEALPPFAGKWFLCTTQSDYCVVDGNTILYAGSKVRLADIDVPAVAEARCDGERLKGGDAKLRLREILNEGDVTLAAAKAGEAERAGARPHLVYGNGRSVGARLVEEGLARPWTGQHQSWCG